MERHVDTNAIRKKMIDKGIKSISELAKTTGKSNNTLCAVLSGKSNPSADVMEAIANALELTPEEAGTIFFAYKLTK